VAEWRTKKCGKVAWQVFILGILSANAVLVSFLRSLYLFFYKINIEKVVSEINMKIQTRDYLLDAVGKSAFLSSIIRLCWQQRTMWCGENVFLPKHYRFFSF
jgi:hypothetical protein